MKLPRPNFDQQLFWACLALSILGLLAIWDAGYARGTGSPLPRELKNQTIYLVAALAVAYGCSFIPRKSWKWLSWVGFGFSALALVAVMLPGIGHSIGGAQRWIKLGVTIQPSEFIKLAAVMFLAATMAAHKPWVPPRKAFRNFGERIDRLWIPKFKRAFPFLLVLGLALAIERQPDLATAAVVVVCAVTIVMVAGVSFRSLATFGIVGSVLVAAAIAQEPYRLERFRVHADRWSSEHRLDGGYQSVVSEMAMARGGLLGVGVGNGMAKHSLPVPTTDFVLTTVGEETGLIGVSVIIGLLGFVTYRLFWLAVRAPDSFARLALTGIGVWIGVQTCVSVMMVNGALPPIGIPLPFVSFGGSSLVALWAAIGLANTVMKETERPKEVVTPASGSYGWRDRRPRVPSA